MADSLEAFFGRLGAYADPVNRLADATCGECAGVFGAADVTMDASEVLSKIIAQYVALSSQGERLRQIMVAKVQVPCEVWSAYAAARQDYLTKSQSVFNQLTQKGVTVEQVVYSGGRAQLDPSGQVRTIRVQAPLRPPAFVGIQQQCPSVPNMQGSAFGAPAMAFGWERTPVEWAGIDPSVLTALGTATTTALLLLSSSGTPLGLAGVNAYKTLKQIAVIWQDYDASPSRILAAYTACFQAAVNAGVPASDANRQCSAVQKSAQDSRVAIERAKADAAKASGLGFFGWLGVITGVAILGTIVIRIVRSKVGAAARLVVPVAGARLPSSRYSRPGDPVLLGDLVLHPRGSYGRQHR